MSATDPPGETNPLLALQICALLPEFEFVSLSKEIEEKELGNTCFGGTADV
jgi:hypothetical protein